MTRFTTNATFTEPVGTLEFFDVSTDAATLNQNDDVLFRLSEDGGIRELVVVVPEPGAGALLLVGLLGLARSRTRRTALVPIAGPLALT